MANPSDNKPYSSITLTAEQLKAVQTQFDAAIAGYRQQVIDAAKGKLNGLSGADLSAIATISLNEALTEEMIRKQDFVGIQGMISKPQTAIPNLIEKLPLDSLIDTRKIKDLLSRGTYDAFDASRILEKLSEINPRELLSSAYAKTSTVIKDPHIKSLLDMTPIGEAEIPVVKGTALTPDVERSYQYIRDISKLKTDALEAYAMREATEAVHGKDSGQYAKAQMRLASKVASLTETARIFLYNGPGTDSMNPNPAIAEMRAKQVKELLVGNITDRGEQLYKQTEPEIFKHSPIRLARAGDPMHTLMQEAVNEYNAVHPNEKVTMPKYLAVTRSVNPMGSLYHGAMDLIVMDESQFHGMTRKEVKAIAVHELRHKRQAESDVFQVHRYDMKKHIDATAPNMLEACKAAGLSPQDISKALPNPALIMMADIKSSPPSSKHQLDQKVLGLQVASRVPGLLARIKDPDTMARIDKAVDGSPVCKDGIQKIRATLPDAIRQTDLRKLEHSRIDKEKDSDLAAAKVYGADVMAGALVKIHQNSSANIKYWTKQSVDTAGHPSGDVYHTHGSLQTRLANVGVKATCTFDPEKGIQCLKPDNTPVVDKSGAKHAPAK